MQITYKKSLLPISIFFLISTFLVFTPVLSYADDHQNTDARCKDATSIVFPQQDMPSEADKKSLSGCSSENLYYGIGVPIDYVKSRQCAFIERTANNESALSGSSILMMIYANGYGVKRDLDMAIKLACAVDSSPMDGAPRIDHLTSLKTKPEKDPFDFCDDVSTTPMITICTYRDQSIEQSKRNAKINPLVSGWPKDHQVAFEKLQKAAQQYFEARANNEVDQAGAEHAIFTTTEQNDLEKNFLASLQ